MLQNYHTLNQSLIKRQTSGTTSVTTSGNEWQRVTRSDSES